MGFDTPTADDVFLNSIGYNDKRCAVTNIHFFTSAVIRSIMHDFYKKYAKLSAGKYIAEVTDIMKYVGDLRIPCVSKLGVESDLIIKDCSYAVIDDSNCALANKGEYTINVHMAFKDGFDSYFKTTDEESPIKKHLKTLSKISVKLGYQASTSTSNRWYKAMGFKKYVSWSMTTSMDYIEYLTEVYFNRFFIFVADTSGRSLNADNKREMARVNVKELKKAREKAEREMEKQGMGATISNEDLDKITTANEFMKAIGKPRPYKKELKIRSKYDKTIKRYIILDRAVDYVMITFTDKTDPNNRWQLKVIY